MIFVCQQDTPETEIDRLVSNLQQTVTEREGTVEKVEKWGTRKLAYRVRKHREGFYVYLSIHGRQEDMVKELERRLKVSDAVMKYLTVRLDEELKRQRKLVTRRERRAARRPRKGAAAPASRDEPAAAS